MMSLPALGCSVHGDRLAVARTRVEKFAFCRECAETLPGPLLEPVTVELQEQMQSTLEIAVAMLDDHVIEHVLAAWTEES